MPWQPSRLTEGPPTTTHLIEVVDAMVYEEEVENQKEEVVSMELKQEVVGPVFTKGLSLSQVLGLNPVLKL